MKTNQTDKATARPWRIHDNGAGVEYLYDGETNVATFNSSLDGQQNDLRRQEDKNRRALIVQAVNEHAALVVLEAMAKLISEGDVMRLNPSFTHADTVLAYQKLMRNALANLAAVREGKV